METISVAMWAANLAMPADNMQSWIAFIESKMAEISGPEPQILLLPEFACMQWLSFGSPTLSIKEQVPWVAAQSVDAMASLRSLAVRYNIALVPGTVPHARGADESADGYSNRAWVFLPDGRVYAQDKLCLTPSERNPLGWMLTAGADVQIIEWMGLRMAVLICLDVEFTALWAKLGKIDLDLVLIPAKTSGLSGYNRVFSCAYARANELQTVVCAVGAIGSPGGEATIDPVLGGAAAYVPSDAALGSTGVAALLEPQSAELAASPILYARELPVGYCRKMRHGAAEAEVWPASWPADRVTIADPAGAMNLSHANK